MSRLVFFHSHQPRVKGIILTKQTSKQTKRSNIHDFITGFVFKAPLPTEIFDTIFSCRENSPRSIDQEFSFPISSCVPREKGSNEQGAPNLLWDQVQRFRSKAPNWMVYLLNREESTLLFYFVYLLCWLILSYIYSGSARRISNILLVDHTRWGTPFNFFSSFATF